MLEVLSTQRINIIWVSPILKFVQRFMCFWKEFFVFQTHLNLERSKISPHPRRFYGIVFLEILFEHPHHLRSLLPVVRFVESIQEWNQETLIIVVVWLIETP